MINGDWELNLTIADLMDMEILQDREDLYPAEVIIMSGSVQAGFCMMEELGPLPRETR